VFPGLHLQLRRQTEALGPLDIAPLSSRHTRPTPVRARTATVLQGPALTHSQHLSKHVRRPSLPALLPPAAALPQMGSVQQAGILLLHRHRLRGSHNGGYRPADPEIHGRGAHPEDSLDIPRYATKKAKRQMLGDGLSLRQFFQCE
jgi:hypothetical protein